jgi:hypothetical protein
MGVVKNDDGSRARGYTLATLRTWLDQAGLITPRGWCPMPVPDLPLCRLGLETTPGLRTGEWFLDDRGCVEGAPLTVRKHQRHVEVLVPWPSTRLSSTAAGPRAEGQEAGPLPPARDHQPMAVVKGVAPLWAACQGPLKACVMRSWNRKQAAGDPIVWVTTAQPLTGPWIVRHDEERPAIEHDDEHMTSGGWPRHTLSSTRDRESVLSLVTGVLRARLSHRVANTQAGARVADQTRQALAVDQLRSRRTPVIA